MTDTDGAASQPPVPPPQSDAASDVPAQQPPAAAASQGDAPDAADAPAASRPVELTKQDATPRGGAHRAAPASRWASYRDGRRAKALEKAKKPHRKAPWWELPALVVLAVLIAILVKTFIVQPFYIPSQSMEHTLHGCPGCSGDRILVNKLIYDFRDPHPGDIVVFHAPPGWDDEPTSKPPGNPILRVIRGFGQLVGVVPPDGQVLVKRVIATGGQSIKGAADGSVYVHNPGQPWRKLNEPYVFRSSPGDGDAGHAHFGPVRIPNGRLWVMGDHRDNSADSRFHCSASGADQGTTDCAQYVNEATVPVDDVIGKAFVIAWPPSRWRTLGTPSTFTSAAAAGASGVPGLVAGSVVLPIFVVRRRRRRR
jgi:signal peptidase I